MPVRSGGDRFEELQVEFDLDDVAQNDPADTGWHGNVDAEVRAADLSGGFEARVAGASRGVLDLAARGRRGERAGDRPHPEVGGGPALCAEPEGPGLSETPR